MDYEYLVAIISLVVLLIVNIVLYFRERKMAKEIKLLLGKIEALEYLREEYSQRIFKLKELLKDSATRLRETNKLLEKLKNK